MKYLLLLLFLSCTNGSIDEVFKQANEYGCVRSVIIVNFTSIGNYVVCQADEYDRRIK
jgi:hypothetical protein